jgi:uncharacterized membrane protein (UPF0136 family)
VALSLFRRCPCRFLAAIIRFPLAFVKDLSLFQFSVSLISSIFALSIYLFSLYLYLDDSCILTACTNPLSPKTKRANVTNATNARKQNRLGGLCMVGGTIGYMKKRSTMSLVAGMGLGSLFLTAGYMIAKTDHVYQGHLVGASTGTILTVAMGQRFFQTRKFMPAGLLTILGVVATIYNGTKAYEWAP